MHTDDVPNSSLAKNAIDYAMKWMTRQNRKYSLDDLVQTLRKQPGAVAVIDERPIAMIVKFSDGSGVGVNDEGLDLLQTTSAPSEAASETGELDGIPEKEALGSQQTFTNHANDNNEPVVLLTPEGNEAQERCPTCERPNSPGACDHCEHFFGSYWDGEILWSERFEAFDSIWSELIDVIHEIDETSPAFREQIEKMPAMHADISSVLELAVKEVSSSGALTEMVAFDHGPTIETDGMLSGSGYSLYLEVPELIDDAIEKVRLLLRASELAKRDTL